MFISNQSLPSSTHGNNLNNITQDGAVISQCSWPQSQQLCSPNQPQKQVIVSAANTDQKSAKLSNAAMTQNNTGASPAKSTTTFNTHSNNQHILPANLVQILQTCQNQQRQASLIPANSAQQTPSYPLNYPQQQHQKSIQNKLQGQFIHNQSSVSSAHSNQRPSPHNPSCNNNPDAIRSNGSMGRNLHQDSNSHLARQNKNFHTNQHQAMNQSKHAGNDRQPNKRNRKDQYKRNQQTAMSYITTTDTDSNLAVSTNYGQNKNNLNSQQIHQRATNQRQVTSAAQQTVSSNLGKRSNASFSNTQSFQANNQQQILRKEAMERHNQQRLMQQNKKARLQLANYTNNDQFMTNSCRIIPTMPVFQS